MAQQIECKTQISNVHVQSKFEYTCIYVTLAEKSCNNFKIYLFDGNFEA